MYVPGGASLLACASLAVLTFIIYLKTRNCKGTKFEVQTMYISYILSTANHSSKEMDYRINWAPIAGQIGYTYSLINPSTVALPQPTPTPPKKNTYTLHTAQDDTYRAQ